MRDIVLVILTLSVFLTGCAASREATRPSPPVHRKTRLAAAPSSRSTVSSALPAFRPELYFCRGIGQIGGKAVEAIARQPEAISKIQTNMIIAAALVEGVALFAVVVALL